MPLTRLFAGGLLALAFALTTGCSRWEEVNVDEEVVTSGAVYRGAATLSHMRDRIGIDNPHATNVVTTARERLTWELTFQGRTPKLRVIGRKPVGVDAWPRFDLAGERAEPLDIEACHQQPTAPWQWRAHGAFFWRLDTAQIYRNVFHSGAAISVEVCDPATNRREEFRFPV